MLIWDVQIITHNGAINLAVLPSSELNVNKERLDECLIIPTFVRNELVVTNVWSEGCLSVSHSAQVGAVLSSPLLAVWCGWKLGQRAPGRPGQLGVGLIKTPNRHRVQPGSEEAECALISTLWASVAKYWHMSEHTQLASPSWAASLVCCWPPGCLLIDLFASAVIIGGTCFDAIAIYNTETGIKADECQSFELEDD